MVLAHSLPFGLIDRPDRFTGVFTLLGMAMMYLFLIGLQMRPHAWTRLRRWSYAGFYVDEVFTRLALRVWPTRWTAASPPFYDLNPQATDVLPAAPSK